jgi:jumonji domain-containing protein 2
VAFPGAFHCGCNLGFNVAEACNFALTSWVPHGIKASRCMCRQNNVEIDMRLFLAVRPRHA